MILYIQKILKTTKPKFIFDQVLMLGRKLSFSLGEMLGLILGQIRCPIL